MTERILFVDDDSNILSAYQRQLRKEFHIETAEGGELGLAAIDKGTQYAVIVADMKMPGMDGVQFLQKVRKRTPDSVRIMLTGNADQQTAIEAINQGSIFRFLTKPCPHDILEKTLTAGIEQYRLITAEKDLLERTLKGSIKVLTDVLSLVNPTAFGCASRVQRLIHTLSAELKVKNSWKIEIAAMLSQLGCITISEDILTKRYNGGNLTEQELQAFNTHPQIASSLISSIPRMEDVAEIIAYQQKCFDGSGIPLNNKCGEEIPLGARMLKLIIDFDSLIATGMDDAHAFEVIRKRFGWYDETIVKALKNNITVESNYNIRFVNAHELAKNMIFAEDIKGSSGSILVTKGQDVTPLLRLRLIGLVQNKDIQEPIKVFVPVKSNEAPEIKL